MRRCSSAISRLVHHAIMLEREEREIAGLLCWNREKINNLLTTFCFGFFWITLFFYIFFPLWNYHLFPSQLLTLVVWNITTINTFVEHHAGAEHLKNTHMWIMCLVLVILTSSDAAARFCICSFTPNVNHKSQSYGIMYRYINWT